MQAHTLAEKMRATLELAELAERLMEQNLRRRHPEATEDEIQALLAQWYRHRPGAEGGDCPGVPVGLSRFE